MKKSIIALFVTYLFGLFFSYTSVAEPPSMPHESLTLSFKTTLLEDTPTYSSPNDTLEPTSVIAPQDVHVVGAEENWSSYQAVTDKKWFKVETWQGEQWVQLEIRKTGIIEKAEMNLWLGKEASLYNTPFHDSLTELKLSSQTVYVIAQYRSKFLNSYLVETWAGQKWLIDLDNNFFPVTNLHQQLELSTTTSIFDTPVPYNGDKGVIEPQIITTYQKYQDNWYRIVTAYGEVGWINKKFAQPVGVKQTDETVEVSVVTPLQKYPYAYEINMGSIAPQKVKAFEKWISAEGEPWFHIRSWQGDAWIRTVKTEYLTKEAALGIAKKMNTNGNVQWVAEFVGEYQIEHSKEIRPVWVVTAIYPAGSKMIVYIDAATGEQVALTEIEAGMR